MNRKTKAVARLAERSSVNVWLVAGMTVKAPTLYDALFVNDPLGRYRQCAVYCMLEDQWFSACDEYREEFNIDDDFQDICDRCHAFRSPADSERLAEEVWGLVGDVELVKTECQAGFCGALTDVDDVTETGCCGYLICCECIEGRDECPMCGAEFTAVDMLNILADR
jgi:hypothetical protein